MISFILLIFVCGIAIALNIIWIIIIIIEQLSGSSYTNYKSAFKKSTLYSILFLIIGLFLFVIMNVLN